jgi:hypothetical protein
MLKLCGTPCIHESTGGAESLVANCFRDDTWLSEPRDVTVGSNSKKIVGDIDILGTDTVPAEK